MRRCACYHRHEDRQKLLEETTRRKSGDASYHAVSRLDVLRHDQQITHKLMK